MPTSSQSRILSVVDQQLQQPIVHDGSTNLETRRASLKLNESKRK